MQGWLTGSPAEESLIRSLAGGKTMFSIFAVAEAVLESSYTEHVQAICYVFGGDENFGEGYHSLLDCLFCELHPEWREACEAFYRGDGPPLSAILTPRQILDGNQRMVTALEVALECWSKKVRGDASSFLEKVDQVLASSQS